MPLASVRAVVVVPSGFTRVSVTPGMSLSASSPPPEEASMNTLSPPAEQRRGGGTVGGTVVGAGAVVVRGGRGDGDRHQADEARIDGQLSSAFTITRCRCEAAAVASERCCRSLPAMGVVKTRPLGCVQRTE